MAKIAVGPKHSDEDFNDWEVILTEIITGDEFGVDRMDYLLRDSLHAGVAYGRFDHHRLIDTLKILPSLAEGDDLTIGIESGGLHAAEGMWLARYFMREQLYFHRVRRAYDLHLKKFLLGWLPDGKFTKNPDEFLAVDDNEVLTALKTEAQSGNRHAKAIINRRHFKILYEFNSLDQTLHPEPEKVIHEAVGEEYGEENVFLDPYEEKMAESDFPVVDLHGNLVPARKRSLVLKQIPYVTTKNVFISPDLHDEAIDWLEERKKEVLTDA